MRDIVSHALSGLCRIHPETAQLESFESPFVQKSSNRPHELANALCVLFLFSLFLLIDQGAQGETLQTMLLVDNFAQLIHRWRKELGLCQLDPLELIVCT